MPTLSATDGGSATSIEQIKRVDLQPEDIRKMTDKEIEDHLALLRRQRETPAPKNRKEYKEQDGLRRAKAVAEQLIDDSDVENNY